MRNCTKVVRVTSRITKMTIKHNIKTSAVTQKCIPLLYESFQNGSLDIKSIGNATVEMITCDIACVSLCVAYVMIKGAYKNVSK